MKKIMFIFLIMLPLLVAAQPHAKIGMNINEVKKLYPAATTQPYEKTVTLSVNDTLYGLGDAWGFRFENNKLDWIFFHKYIDSLTQPNFDLCLNAYKNIVKDFSTKYGKPDSTITGNTSFIDPYIKHHWGYDVCESRWENADGMKISVEFTFMGGKGEYHFLVTINIFDKTYPYWN